MNYGIAGDTVGGLASRFDPEAYRNAGRLVVMIGVNDLQEGRMPDAEPLAQMLCALGRPVTWLSVLPVNAEMHRREIRTRSPSVHTPSRAEVDALNAEIASAANRCPTTTFADIRPAFVDGDGQLRQPLTVDGLHLSAKGMSLLIEAIRG